MLEDRAWLVQLLDAGGVVVGAGFAVGGSHVLTCAHVIHAAGAAGPGDVVSVDFPRLGGAGCEAEVLVEGWVPEAGTAGDVALLRLQHPPADLSGVPLRPVRSLDGVGFSAYGFPDELPDGVWARGSLGLGVGEEWVQLEPGSARNVAPGFSGTAVWSDEHQAVVGMMVARDPDVESGVAFAIPVGVLARDSGVVQDALPTALELDPAARTHWDASARGVQAGETGWLFTGRRRALTELVGWLESDEPSAMRVVTGSPGAGKSAVLARLVTTSDRRYRERMPELAVDDPTVPPKGAVDVTFDANGKTVADFVAHLAAVCELDARDVHEVVIAVAARDRRQVVVVDGLDEATEPEALAGALGQVARAGGRVLVGCRPHLAARLRDLEPMHLDEPPWLEEGDIKRYVARRLEGEPVVVEDTPRLVGEVAAAAAGNFLVAQLIADGIAHTGRVTRPFPTDVGNAFRERLDNLPEPDAARELLLPLAYAVGDGMPEGPWLSAAAALSRPHQRGDLRRLLRGPAGSFVLTFRHRDGEDGYRLFHQALAETLAGESDPAGDQRTLWRAWMEALPQTPSGRRRWADAPRYLLDHAPEHSAAADALSELADDAGFLLSGNVTRLSIQLAAVAPSTSPTTTALLRLAGAQAQRLGPEQRATLLSLAALHLGLPSLRDRLVTEGSPRWRPRWAHRLGAPHQKLTGHTGPVRAVAFGRAGDRDIVASGGDDGLVRIWDAVSGELLGEPLAGHTGAVSSVATGRLVERDVVVSAGDDGLVRIWDAVSGELVGEPLAGHTGAVSSVATRRLVERDVVVSAGEDGFVRIWDAASRALAREPLRVHSIAGRSQAVRSVAVGRAGERDIVVAGGLDRRLRVWDAMSGELVGEPLVGDTRGARSVAVSRAAERGLVVWVADDGVVRMSDAMTRQFFAKPLAGRAEGMQAVAVGQLGDREAVVLGGSNGTVWLWDVESGERVGQPLVGHTGSVLSIALDRVADRDVVVSGGEDGTVRLWDAVPGQPVGDPLAGHTGTVSSIALGRLGDRDVVVSGSEDGTARVWDAMSGEPLSKPLVGHSGPVFSVALGRLGDRDVVVSGGYGLPSVLLWDAVSGEPVGKPLNGHGWVRSVALGRGRVWSAALGRVEDRDDVVISAASGHVALSDAVSGAFLERQLDKLWVWSMATGRLGEHAVVLTGDGDGVVRLWDELSFEPVGEPLTGHAGIVWSVVLGRVRDRDVVVSGGEDGLVRWWDAVSGRPVGQPPVGHAKRVRSVAVGRVADRDIIVSGSEDGTVGLWDGETGARRDTIAAVETLMGVAVHSCGALYVATGNAVCCLAEPRTEQPSGR